MNELHNYWISVVDEKKKLADELINQAHALLFSVRMIVGLLVVKGNEEPVQHELSCGRLEIRALDAAESRALTADLQGALNLLNDKIKAFIPDAESVVRSVDAHASAAGFAREAQSLIDLQDALNQSVVILENLVTRR